MQDVGQKGRMQEFHTKDPEKSKLSTYRAIRQGLYSKYSMYSKYNTYGEYNLRRVAAYTASTTCTASTISTTRRTVKLPQRMTKLQTQKEEAKEELKDAIKILFPGFPHRGFLQVLLRLYRYSTKTESTSY